MSHDPRPDPESQFLPEEAAKRLLERASVLDAARADGSQIAQLRAVAQEAGISKVAFDAALAELAAAESPPIERERTRRRGILRRLALATAAGFTLLVGAFVALRMVAPAGPPIVAREFRVTCTTPQNAADLIRPLADGRSTSIILPPSSSGSRLIRVTATRSDMDRIAELLRRMEGPNGTGCSVPYAAAPS